MLWLGIAATIGANTAYGAGDLAQAVRAAYMASVAAGPPLSQGPWPSGSACLAARSAKN
jgi:hypothetical protein